MVPCISIKKGVMNPSQATSVHRTLLVGLVFSIWKVSIIVPHGLPWQLNEVIDENRYYIYYVSPWWGIIMMPSREWKSLLKITSSDISQSDSRPFSSFLLCQDGRDAGLFEKIMLLWTCRRIAGNQANSLIQGTFLWDWGGQKASMIMWRVNKNYSRDGLTWSHQY